MGRKGGRRKTTRSRSSKHRQKTRNGFAKGGNSVLGDCISQLPNDVLVSVLSQLTIKEAATTSILSSQWRHLWELTTNLIFDDPVLFNRSGGRAADRDLQKMAGHYFAKSVNHVLRFCRSQTIEQFVVRFPLCQSFKRHVDKWLKFALSRELYRLDLDFSAMTCAFDYYALPFSLFSTLATSIIGFKSLKALYLKGVGFGNEVFAFILSNFPILVHFTINGNLQLSRLKVTNPSLKLKYLDVQCCFDLMSIEIRDVNLVSFKYKGRAIKLCIQNVPFLAEFYIGGRVSGFLKYIFAMPSCYLSQVETLTLDLLESWPITKFDVLSELSNLQKFKVKITPRVGFSLLAFASLTEVAPYLHEFVMEISWNSTPMFSAIDPIGVPKCPHRHLKKVELAGYCGRPCDLELAMFFFENAIALEKMVVVPYSEGCRRQQFFSLEKAARGRAKQQLIGKAPPGVELTIL